MGKKRDTKAAATVNETAELCGVTPRYVRAVLNADRKSERVLSAYMALSEGKNALLAQVKQLIPLN